LRACHASSAANAPRRRVDVYAPVERGAGRRAQTNAPVLICSMMAPRHRCRAVQNDAMSRYVAAMPNDVPICRDARRQRRAAYGARVQMSRRHAVSSFFAMLRVAPLMFMPHAERQRRAMRVCSTIKFDAARRMSQRV